MTSASPLLALGTEQFVSLTTFRKTGEGVPTPVWVTSDGDALIITTLGESGKVKRIRNNSGVELRPSTMRGKVDERVPAITAQAQIVDDLAEVERYKKLFEAKYKLQHRLFTWMESRGKSGSSQRVMLRIT